MHKNDKKYRINSYMAKEKIEDGNKHFKVIRVYIVFVQKSLYTLYRYFKKYKKVKYEDSV